MAPSLEITSINLALGVCLLPAFLLVGQAIYNIFFHPLRSFPGPLLWRLNTITRVYYLARGRLPHKVLELHATYGPIVRIAPNELAFSDPQAWQDIYGFRKQGEGEMAKWWGVYRPFGTEPPSVISANREEHGAVRRLLSHGFSDRALREQEPLIGSYVDLLIRRLREKCDGGAASLDMRDWYNYTISRRSGE
ncbi:hypothetical protein GQX73_g8477 [Xylaria multiplex]|uniref:Cytochrome P450 n=1 Tax=Xylaria multiplex TaxID=323545 RepID=A0A7C8MKQ2_9PEZI|nr:hypothetical protein GQX73_g8477 [Xylaria multiplex]